MVSMPSTEAKTRFGALLDIAQRNPVTIEKKGSPIPVMISETKYAAYQQLKMQALQSDLTAGIRQADEGQLVESETEHHPLARLL